MIDRPSLRRAASLLVLATAIAPTCVGAQVTDAPTDPAATTPAQPAQASETLPESVAIQPDRPRVRVVPYLGVDQLVSARLAGVGTDDDVIAVTALSAGVDASIATRRAEGSIGLRYDRRIGWSDDAGDGDSLSGLARGRYQLLRGLQLEAGGLASRSTVGGRAFGGGLIRDDDRAGEVYSLYAGPTFARRLGDLDVGAGYRFGYTRIDGGGDARLGVPGGPLLATSDRTSSTNHALWGSVGQRPGNWLPFGWQLSGGWDREDASPFDQRYDGRYVRADATMPVSRTLALVAGVGYEDIEVSQRRLLRDAAGVPVLDAGGRPRADTAAPRQLTYATDGLIWDAGVLWRPSRRTSLSAKVGRRYGDTFYSGSLAYQPSSVTSVSVGVYTGLSSAGRGLSGTLAGLPTLFDVTRNPLDGQLDPCVFGEGGSACIDPVFGAARAAQFRSRGVQASIGTKLADWSLGLGAGFEERSILAPELEALLGVDALDETSYYLFASAGRAIDARSSLSLSAYVNRFDGASAQSGGGTGYGATASYGRQVMRRLGATAAVGLSAFDPAGANTELLGTALIGLRYSFD